MKKIVTIGGGTGHSQVLLALKSIPDIAITAICPSTDSGGSTGTLQREYDGSGYTGDLTKCIIALCDDEIMSKTLSFRYQNGSLDGHPVKNLLFHALEKVSTPEHALETMWKICSLGDHRVLPITHEKTELCARLSMGNTISGETNIDTIARNPLWNPDVHSISEIYLKPAVAASRMATDAVAQADCIVVCPGDLYSSIIPVLLPIGMKESVKNSNAKVVLILNIMTKKGETDNYTAEDFIERIEERLGKRVDHVVYNDAFIPPHVLLKYSLEKKVELSLCGVEDDRIISAPLAAISDEDQIFTNPAIVREVLTKIIQ